MMLGGMFSIVGDIPPLHAVLVMLPVIILPAIVYGSSTRSGLHKQFPIAGLDGDGGFNNIDQARKRWLAEGAEIIENGLKKARIPFLPLVIS